VRTGVTIFAWQILVQASGRTIDQTKYFLGAGVYATPFQPGTSDVKRQIHNSSIVRQGRLATLGAHD
jgi:hypothetical protein